MLKPSEREYLGYHSGEETDPDEWKPTEFEIIKRKMYQWIDEKIREEGFYPLGCCSIHFSLYLL